MNRTRNLLRRACRSPTTRAWRALTRPTVRSLFGRHRRPNELSSALTAFGRGIRCHRRLAKLAPRFFDSTVINREARERDERRRWMATWEPLLDKVYGPSRDPDQRPRETDDELAPLPRPHTCRAVERELAGWSFWMDLGRLAMARHQRFRPHAIPSLSQLARLLQIAFDFGQLACGLHASQASALATQDAC